VIVNDNGSHLRGSEVRVVKSSDESQMVFGGEGLSQEMLPSARRKKDHGVTQVNDRHSTTLIEPPSVADRRWHRHLATRRDQELRWNGHSCSSRTW
jgi:hypothetical protein